MTPREALYNICIELGPIPRTDRNDNLSPRERRLRDSIRALQNFIDYHDASKHTIPDSAEEYRRGTWAADKAPEEFGLPPLSREDFIE
jgi:hypothetical protein